MTSADGHGADPPAVSVRTWLAAGTVVVTLVAVAMRRSLRITNADSLVSGLISTQHLTAYYWGQDRLASVLPALAWPIQDVRWNHLAQTAALATSFFVLLGAFVLFHAGGMQRRPAPGALILALAVTGGLALLVLDRSAAYVLMLEQQYAFSTVLFLAGLVGCTGSTRRAWVAGGVAIVLALVVIPSTVLLLPAVLVVRSGRTPRSARIRTAVIASGAFVVSTISSRVLAPDYPASATYTSFSPSRLADGLPLAWANIRGSLAVVPAVAVASASVAVLIVRRRHLDRTLAATYLACPVVAVAWVALFSANEWVEINAFSFRYFFVAYAAAGLVVAAAVTETCAWVARRTRHPIIPRTAALTAAAWVGFVGAVISAVIVVDRTSVPAVDAGASLAAQADGVGADVVVGDYWRTWPAVFADRAAGGDLLAATQRAEALRSEFEQLGGSGRGLDALCVDTELDACVRTLDDAAGPGWTVVDVRSSSPLVIRVSQAP